MDEHFNRQIPETPGDGTPPPIPFGSHDKPTNPPVDELPPTEADAPLPGSPFESFPPIDEVNPSVDTHLQPGTLSPSPLPSSAPALGGATYVPFGAPQPDLIQPPYAASGAPPQYQGGYPAFAPGTPNQAPAASPTTKKKHPGLVVLAVLVFIVIVVTGTIFISDLIDKSNTGGPLYGDNTTLNLQSTPNADVEIPKSGTVLTSEQLVAKLQPSVVGIVLFSSRQATSVGSASGIIMGEDSTKKYTYIITCAHVINDTSGLTVKVQFEDGSQINADIVGYDTRTDLGVIRIKKTGLKAAEFGNSETLKAGEPVWAIGNPAGMDFYGSATTGIVSSIGRDMKSENEMKLIQHDAAINPGNSGGPLVNKYGQVIGIVSLKIVSDDIEGMGFAIPTTPAKEIIDKIIKNGYVPNRARLGISFIEASQSYKYSPILQMKKLPVGSLIIMAIDKNGALADTDARVNDLIVAVNGKKLDKSDILLEVIQKSKPGDTLMLSLVRVFSDYSTQEFTVKAKLIEDKGDSNTVTPEDPDVLLPF
ncbi:MAG: trypsin-like peptidase domain-containing protein [Oscillospiraceae bacterium]|jgi:serine protease Do|nr:trypsin-like peptidase domain-containing protein [Oscillospiraceae bacterium]